MIEAANKLTELYLSCAAILGLAMLNTVLTGRDAYDPLNRRFIFCLRLAMLLFLGRVLIILTGVQAFRFLVLLAAGLIPLGALLLTEGLLRRHAPAWIKGTVGGGAIFFSITSLWYSDSIDPYRLVALLLFQILGFALAGWLIVMRDRASLSAGENTMVVRLGVSLLLFIPMAAGDFLFLYLGLPIQVSALSVLVLCWLAIGLGRPHFGHRATLLSFAVMVSASLFLATMIGTLGELGRDGTIMAMAAITATLFLVAVFNDARTLRYEEQSHGLLRKMAQADTDDPLEFLRSLQSHPLVEGAVIVSEDSLQGLQSDTLQRIFDTAPVLRRTDPPALGDMAADHMNYLFERYGATHIILASATPRVLVALAMPSLGTSPNAELELEVVQRMAALMAKKGQTHG